MSDPVDALADAAAARRDAEAAVADAGEPRVETVASAYASATRLLDRYEGSATGTGDFGAYVEFQERFVDLVENLPEDLPTRDAFEAANDTLDQRRLTERDFERARETLSPAADIAGLLDDRAEARERYREARRAVEKRLDELNARITELERLSALGEEDLDAPVGVVRKPIAAYNDAVREAFATFRREEPARAVLSFVSATEAYPLVDYRPPPADLASYLASAPVGMEPIPTLLEYAAYSPSKRAHYVEDASAFQRSVCVHRTYLERLDADPLSVSWPPPPAARLRFRARELVAVVGRFAPDEVVAKARALRDVSRDNRYEPLRRAAEARAELTVQERERLVAGEVADELAAARAERETLREALARHPEP